MILVQFHSKKMIYHIIISGLIGILLLIITYILSKQRVELEKLSPYECGFNPFKDAREEYDVKYYLIAILFIIFDLEISFLFPWIINLNKLSEEGYWSMFLFLFILTIGFIYEWINGALEFEK